MKAKLVRESLDTKGYEGGNSFGKKEALSLVRKYMPFLKGVQYDELEPRGTPEDPSFGQDEEYAKWDQLSFRTGVKGIDDWGPCVYLIQPFGSDKIYAKLYLDTVNFNGYGESNDEYTSELEPIALEDWDEARYKSAIEDMKENYGN